MYRRIHCVIVLLGSASMILALSGCHGAHTLYVNLEHGVHYWCLRQISRAAVDDRIARFQQHYRFSSCVQSHGDFLNAVRMNSEFHQEHALRLFERCTQHDPSALFRRACIAGMVRSFGDIDDFKDSADFATRLHASRRNIESLWQGKSLSVRKAHAPWERATRPYSTAVRFVNYRLTDNVPVMAVLPGVSRKAAITQLKKDGSLSGFKQIRMLHERIRVRYLIPVEIQGRHRWMILDTGSPDTVIFKSFAAQLKVSMHEVHVHFRFPYLRESFSQVSYTVLNLKVGADTFDRLSVLVPGAHLGVPINGHFIHGKPVVGILGLDVLRRFGSIRIDRLTHRVDFGKETTGGHCARLFSTGISSSANVSDLSWLGAHPAMRAEIAGRSVRWIIDSGWEINDRVNAGAALYSAFRKVAGGVREDPVGFKVLIHVPTNATTSGVVDVQRAPGGDELGMNAVTSAPAAFARRYIGFNFARGTVCYE